MAKKRASEKTQGTAPSTTRRIETVPTGPGGVTPVFYANNATVDVSNWDVKLRFGQVQLANPETVTVADILHVYMSHEHFKAYVNALAGLLEKLEAGRQPAK